MIRSKLRSPQERRWLRVLSTLNEFQARLFLANQALDQGRGGISRISALTGMSRTMSALLWTNKSTEAIAAELTRRGHPISDRTVARMLDEMGTRCS